MQSSTKAARLGVVLLSAALCGGSQFAAAQTSSIYNEQGQVVRAPRNVVALDAGLFGDKLNLSTGGLEFVQQDVSIPGNNKLPVAVGRRLTIGGPRPSNAHFAHWDLEIPRLHGIYANGSGWTAPDGSGARCSNFNAPPGVSTSVGGGAGWSAQDFWHGHMLYVPGAGDQEILQRNLAGVSAPTDGNSYPLITAQRWVLRCLPTMARGSGEGFVAVSPDGTQYRFDWMVDRPATTLSRPAGAGSSFRAAAITDERMDGDSEGDASRSGGFTPMAAGGDILFRKEIWILPTQVTDRFGNTVTYTYDSAKPWNLSSITSSDSRTLNLTYNANNFIATVTAPSTSGDRTWTYTYGVVNGANTLTTVTQPDSRTWQLSGIATLVQPRELYQIPPDCDSEGTLMTTVTTASMTHPSGAVGSFSIRPTLRARSFVDRQCKYGSNPDAPWAIQARYFVNEALTSKSITGAGLSGLTWSYQYSPASGQGSWLNCTGSCPVTQWTEVTDARGYKTRHTFGNRYRATEGQLQRVDEGWNGTTAVRSTATRYRAYDAGPYTAGIGTSVLGKGDGVMGARLYPVDQRVITQQGVNFTWEASSFDTLARPLSIARTGPSGARSETTAYADNTARWVLGQTATVTSNGLTMVENSYDPNTATLLSVKQFGVLQSSYGYNTDGTLASKADGAGHTTFLSNYKRGLARNADYPTGASEHAEVDDLGFITSVTDAASYTTGYGYDSMGRLASITPPGGFTAAQLVFESVSTAEYGLPAGHWRQTITRGNAKTITYFDAMYRGLMTRTYDAGQEAATRKVVVKAFDADNRVTFESYPQRDLTSVAVTSPGSRTQYDALGRATQVQADSELGVLTTTSSYLSGFQTQATNPRNKTTTQSFWALDDPSKAQLAGISAPESVTVSISRDAFGKPTAITRGGTSQGSNAGYTNSVTRRYVYDAGQRLCKTIEPEVGSTVQTYDAANNIQWKAPGQNLPDAGACNDTSVAAAAKLTYGYDNLNRLLSVTYGDGSPTVTRTYTPDGLLQTVDSAGATWTYGYNALREPATETLNYAGQNYGISWGYNSAGDLSSLTYPDNSSVSYSPNALGEAQSVGGYASSITYHPNGAVAGYTLGNGIGHSLTQNTRGLPLVNRDAGVVQDQYTYDANGNVTSIADQQEGIFSRSMTYDDLDRLASASSPNTWGSATYKYDTVDNLRSAVVGSRSSTFNFDANNQLASVTTNGSTANYGFDVRGNLTSKGGQTFGFDIGNRLSWSSLGGSYAYDGLGRRFKVASSDGSTRIQAYNQAGQLLWSTSVGGPWTANTIAYIYLGGKQIAESRNGVIQYAHTDALGSPVAHTTSTGVVLHHARFEPYGYVPQGTKPGAGTSLIGFTGHVQDAETDLVYMQQRYYDPIVGRFLSVDPLVSDASTGKGFGRYIYVDANPYKYIDPDGRDKRDEQIAREQQKQVERQCAGGAYCSTGVVAPGTMRTPAPPSETVGMPGGTTFASDQDLDAIGDLLGSGIEKTDETLTSMGPHGMVVAVPFKLALVVGRLAKIAGPLYKTTKEAQVAAELLGFRKIAGQVHGQAVFQKGKFFISRDIDGHNGGAWKMATSLKDLGSKETRLGTYNAALERIGD